MRGKSNLDEFGMGSSNTNSHFGPVTNPLYEGETRIPGGSSGGSAAVVRSGMVDFSLGTDTGGSIRQPASHCGIYGFKPSYGRLSRWGVVAYAQSLDTVGILAKNLDVTKEVFGILDVYDSKDPTSLPQSSRDELVVATRERDAKRAGKYVFGVPQEYLIEELSDENLHKMKKVIAALIDQGHTVRPVAIPSIKKALSAYYTIATAEAASNLSRYDGLRYGTTTDTTSDKYVAANRSNGFGKEVQRRIILGNYTMSSESGDHYFKATETRQQLVNEFNQVFSISNALTTTPAFSEEGCDFLISPTTIEPAVEIEEYLKMEQENMLKSFANDILTVPISLAGLPAVSVPITDSSSSRSTQGIQICGQYGDDTAVMEIAQELNTCK